MIKYPGTNTPHLFLINCGLPGESRAFYHFCFWPYRPVRARFHGLFSVTSIQCHVTFFCIFSMFFRASARLVHVDVANVLRQAQYICNVYRACHAKPFSCWNHTTFVFKVLRNGLLRYILYTCPNLWLRSCSKCYGPLNVLMCWTFDLLEQVCIFGACALKGKMLTNLATGVK